MSNHHDVFKIIIKLKFDKRYEINMTHTKYFKIDMKNVVKLLLLDYYSLMIITYLMVNLTIFHL